MTDCHLIEGGLYQGARPVRGLPADVQAILNLEFDREYDYERVYMDDDTRPKDLPVIKAYAEMPIHDQFFPGVRWLRLAVGQLELWRNDDLTVYVHCTAGISRSSMVVAAYLMKTHGWTSKAAIDHIQRKREEAYPNSSFRAGLNEYYEHLHR
jgi:protein-tyrosine phosphatase